MQRGLGSALASSQLPQPRVRPRSPACSSCAPNISIFLWVSPWGVFGVGWDRTLPCPGFTSCGAAPLLSIRGGREGCCALVARLHPQLFFSSGLFLLPPFHTGAGWSPVGLGMGADLPACCFGKGDTLMGEKPPRSTGRSSSVCT